MKRGTPDHPKLLMLAAELKRLGIQMPRTAAVGILELLWHWSSRYAIQGDVGRWPDEIIEHALEWAGEPGALIRALVATGWLDEAPMPYRLVVHDVADHADNVWRQCLEDAGLTWWDGTPARRSRVGRPSCREAPDKLQRNSSEIQEKLQRNSSESPQPEPEPEPAARARAGAGAGSQSRRQRPDPACLPASHTTKAAEERQNGYGVAAYRRALEAEISRAVGRDARPGTAMQLIRNAAAMGVHPKYLLGWVADRTSSGRRAKSDGLFLSAISDLPGWVRANHCHDPTWDLRESVSCPRCGGAMYVFRDAVVPCLCEVDHGACA